MRFQFTLQTLLLSVVVIWSSMAALPVLVVSVLLLLLRPRRREPLGKASAAGAPGKPGR